MYNAVWPLTQLHLSMSIASSSSGMNSFVQTRQGIFTGEFNIRLIFFRCHTLSQLIVFAVISYLFLTMISMIESWKPVKPVYLAPVRVMIPSHGIIILLQRSPIYKSHMHEAWALVSSLKQCILPQNRHMLINYFWNNLTKLFVKVLL